MAKINGYFKVNKVKVIKSNIQYTVLFLDDRMIFVKTGGQFADISILARFVVIILSSGLGILAVHIFNVELGLVIAVLVFYSTLVVIPQLLTSKKKVKYLTDMTIKYLSEMTNKEILLLDKNNFELRYVDIYRIEAKNSIISLNGLRTGILNIQTHKKFSYDIAMNQDFEKCRTLITTFLPSKVL